MQANKFIREAMRLARELTILADETDAIASDNDCHILAGVVRDCAYQIRAQAERVKHDLEAKAEGEEKEVQRWA